MLSSMLTCPLVGSGFTCSSKGESFAYYTSGLTTDSRIMMQVRWKSSDLSLLETHPLTPGLKFVSPTPTPTGGTIGPTGARQTPTFPHVADEGNGYGAISTGVKAGIGAGVGVAAVLGCIALVTFIRRYRSKRLQLAEMQVEVGDPGARWGDSDAGRLADQPLLPIKATSQPTLPEAKHITNRTTNIITSTTAQQPPGRAQLSKKFTRSVRHDALFEST
ncbi:hypothetical protein B0T14DRAFT_561835 [Immersiella caudata]|uniref:Uncharacterized protein n=1 Tax=Immersiella caudata TaxID=314043 RepID=A0AA39X254_9PEZI|nr:hypothetical protein B0T14DRAFT_561835 [Immersiella caudata]